MRSRLTVWTRDGWAGPSFLAVLLFEKYGQHQPLRTLALVARDLGTDEDWLAELANGMDPEDGLIWVYGIDDEDDTMAFTDIGVENLAILIADLGSSRSRQSDNS